MTNFGLQTGLRALLSAQYLMDTVGHNIANANVDGYSRQRVDLGAALPINRSGLLLGTGVNALGVQRSVDSILGRRMLDQTSIAGGLQAQLLNLYEVETLLNEPDGVSLGGRFDGFFSSISELSSSPGDTILRTGVVQSGVELAAQMNQLAGGVGRVTGSVLDEVEVRIKEVNALAQELATLNVQIAEAQGSGITPNDLLDQQDRALSELSQLVDVQAVRTDSGAVRVLVSGATVVGLDAAQTLTARRTSTTQLEIRVGNSPRALEVRGGAIGGLLQLAGDATPQLQGRLDELARNLILEFNREHATGLPAGGPFTSLTSANGILDLDGDGSLLDEHVADGGLPFEVSGGQLHVNVEDLDTGTLSRHTIEIDPQRTRLGDLLDQLNGIDNLSASVDGFGRLQIVSDTGYGFDFSTRLDTTPDSAGGLGGGAASLGAGLDGPFALVGGETLDLVADPGGTPVPLTITFDAADFDDPGEATAAEVAAAINADPNAQANGIVARAQGGQLFLQTTATGRDADFQLAGGTAVGALGWGGVVGNTVQGHEDHVDVKLSGSYTGDLNERLTFRPNMDGVVGTTPGLAIEVYDSAGQLLTTLDVGENYQPGQALGVAHGIEVSFGLGEVSATDNDSFSTDLLVESDETDLLVGFGLNSFFVGHDAETIGVREDIELDPQKFSASGSGATSDTSQLLRYLQLEDLQAEGLQGRSFGAFYGDLVGEVGTDVNVAQTALDVSDAVMASLEQRREQVSGVNVDEELVDMLRFEQAFSAASRFLTTVNQMNDEILGLL